MKKLLLPLLLIFIVGCVNSDKLIEVTYMDYKKDTIMCDAHHFNLTGATLEAIRSQYYGGNYIVSLNVKYYKILNQP